MPRAHRKNTPSVAYVIAKAAWNALPDEERAHTPHPVDTNGPAFARQSARSVGSLNPVPRPLRNDTMPRRNSLR